MLKVKKDNNFWDKKLKNPNFSFIFFFFFPAPKLIASMDDYGRFSRGSSSNAANRSSNATSRSLVAAKHTRLPVCGCKSTMRFHISGSDLNPGRPYWKCINWMKQDSCKLFVWNDELSEHLEFRDVPSSTETVGGVSSESHSCHGCVYAERTIEVGNKKKEKMKAKLGYEREMVKGLTTRIRWLQFLLFLSWVIFVVYVAWNQAN